MAFFFFHFKQTIQNMSSKFINKTHYTKSNHFLLRFCHILENESLNRWTNGVFVVDSCSKSYDCHTFQNKMLPRWLLTCFIVVVKQWIPGNANRELWIAVAIVMSNQHYVVSRQKTLEKLKLLAEVENFPFIIFYFDFVHWFILYPHKNCTWMHSSTDFIIVKLKYLNCSLIQNIIWREGK